MWISIYATGALVSAVLLGALMHGVTFNARDFAWGMLKVFALAVCWPVTLLLLLSFLIFE